MPINRIAVRDEPDEVPLSFVVGAAAVGDEQAWRTLVRRYDRTVRLGVRRVDGLTREDRDDAAATTWLRLVDEIRRLRNPDALPGWLRTTAYREALRIAAGRKRAAVPLDDAMLDAIGVEVDLTAGVTREQLRAVLAQSMRHLSPTGRRLLVALVDDPDASYREIERRHGIQVSSIGPIRQRIRTTLRPALAQIGMVDAGARSPDGSHTATERIGRVTTTMDGGLSRPPGPQVGHPRSARRHATSRGARV